MTISKELNINNEIRQLQKKMLSYLQQHWKWFAAEGVFFIIMGIIAIIIPNVFTEGITLFLGWLLMVCGIIQIVRSLSIRNMPGFGLWLFSGILQVVIGYFLVTDTLEGIMTLTLLLTVFFAIEGLSKIYLAFMMRPLERWGGMFFSGLTTLLLAIIVWVGWPGTALWVMGLLLGINMIFAGWSLLNISLYHKSL